MAKKKKEAQNTTVNTTENVVDESTKPRLRELTEDDKKAIFHEFSQGGTSVDQIATKYDIESREVFAIADEVNTNR